MNFVRFKAFKGYLKGFVKSDLRVGCIGDTSNFYEHCEAVVNFEKAVKNKVEGQYRKKKLL